MIVLGITLPEVGDQGTCMVSQSDCSTGCLTTGAVDVMLHQYNIQDFSYSAVDYTVAVMVRNNIDIGSTTTGGDAIFMQRIEVDLEYLYAPEDPAYVQGVADAINSNVAFYTATSGTVEAGDVRTYTNIPLLPAPALQEMAESICPRGLNPPCPPGQSSPFTHPVRATLRFVGDRGNVPVESNGYKFPIQICKGCLALGIDNPQLLCDGSSPATVGLGSFCGHPCNRMPFDVPVTCCMNGSNPICPATSISDCAQ